MRSWLACALVQLAFLAWLSGEAGATLINNGLAPPNPTNVIDDDSLAEELLEIANLGCARRPPCSSATPTHVEMVDDAVLDWVAVYQDSSFSVSGGSAGSASPPHSGLSVNLFDEASFVLDAALTCSVLLQGSVQVEVKNGSAAFYPHAGSPRIAVTGGDVDLSWGFDVPAVVRLDGGELRLPRHSSGLELDVFGGVVDCSYKARMKGATVRLSGGRVGDVSPCEIMLEQSSHMSVTGGDLSGHVWVSTNSTLSIASGSLGAGFPPEILGLEVKLTAFHGGVIEIAGRHFTMLSGPPLTRLRTVPYGELAEDGYLLGVLPNGEAFGQRLSVPVHLEGGIIRLIPDGVNNNPDTGALFQGLGDLPGGETWSAALGVSFDGRVVVGESSSANGIDEAFLWSEESGLLALGDLPGGEFWSEAWAASSDGSVIVGGGESGAGREAFRWSSADGMVGLGDLPGGSFFSIAKAVSVDGLVVVGTSRSARGFEAFRWNAGQQMQTMGETPEAEYAADARDVSADGGIVVGQTNLGHPYRWTAAGGIEVLSSTSGSADRVSTDGTMIVGVLGEWDAPIHDAVRWTFGGTDPAVEILFSAPRLQITATSGDTARVSAWSRLWGSNAALWEEGGVLRPLDEALAEAGFDLGAEPLGPWITTAAFGSSGDGRVLVGWGLSPGRSTSAWIMRWPGEPVPEPSGGLLAACALLTLAVLRRRAHAQAT